MTKLQDQGIEQLSLGLFKIDTLPVFDTDQSWVLKGHPSTRYFGLGLNDEMIGKVRNKDLWADFTLERIDDGLRGGTLRAGRPSELSRQSIDSLREEFKFGEVSAQIDSLEDEITKIRLQEKQLKEKSLARAITERRHRLHVLVETSVDPDTTVVTGLFAKLWGITIPTDDLSSIPEIVVNGKDGKISRAEIPTLPLSWLFKGRVY